MNSSASARCFSAFSCSSATLSDSASSSSSASSSRGLDAVGDLVLLLVEGGQDLVHLVQHLLDLVLDLVALLLEGRELLARRLVLALQALAGLVQPIAQLARTPCGRAPSPSRPARPASRTCRSALRSAPTPVSHCEVRFSHSCAACSNISLISASAMGRPASLPSFESGPQPFAHWPIGSRCAASSSGAPAHKVPKADHGVRSADLPSGSPRHGGKIRAARAAWCAGSHTGVPLVSRRNRMVPWRRGVLT